MLSTASNICERAALEKELSALVGFCPSFTWRPSLCSGPCHSPELCCWYTCVQINTFLIFVLIAACWFDFLAWSCTCLVTVDFLISTGGWLWLLSLDTFGYSRAAPLLLRSVPLPTCYDSWLLKEQPDFTVLWCLASLHPLITIVIKYCYESVWDSVTLNNEYYWFRWKLVLWSGKIQNPASTRQLHWIDILILKE